VLQSIGCKMWSICESAGVGGDVDVMEGRGHCAKRRKFIGGELGHRPEL
jgi:hypothetical protein